MRALFNQKNLRKTFYFYFISLACVCTWLVTSPLFEFTHAFLVWRITGVWRSRPHLTKLFLSFCRFSDDIKYMTNKPPRFIWRWCWKVISPVTIFVVLSMSIKSMSESTPQYTIWDEKQVIAFMDIYIFLISILCSFNVSHQQLFYLRTHKVTHKVSERTYELTKLPAPRWLVSSVGRALHRYRWGHGFESRSGLNFVQALISQQQVVCVTAMINHKIISFSAANSYIWSFIYWFE